MFFMSVVLPTPLRPMTQVTLPGAAVDGDVAQGLHHAVGKGEVVESRSIDFTVPKYASMTSGSACTSSSGRRPALCLHSSTVTRLIQSADEIHVVLDDDDRVAAFQFQQQLGGQFGFLVGQSGGGFVDQQQLWIGDDQHADLEPLPLAVAEIFRGRS